MSKVTAAEGRLITNAVAIAATRLLFDALKRNSPSRPLSETVTIHNGQGLRAIDREDNGKYNVYASGGLVGKHSAKLTENPFVVIGRKGSAGKLTYARFGGWVTDTAYFAQPNDDQDLNCEFLFHAISSLDFTDDIISTAIPGINRTSIYRHSIPIPSQKIQEACVKFLNAAADKCRNGSLPELPAPFDRVRVVVARIEELSAKNDEACRLRYSTIKESAALIQAARRKLIGEDPKKSWVPLSIYVQEIENGWSPACENRAASGAEWAVLKVGAVSFGKFDPKQNKALPISLSPVKRYEVRAGDFLMSRANTTELAGACAVVEETPSKLMLSDKIFRFVFRADARLNLRYLWHVLSSPVLRDQIERGATGTSPTMKNISKEKVLKLQIPMHDWQAQERIAAELDDLQTRLDAVITLQDRTSKELNALMPSILSLAFSGTL